MRIEINRALGEYRNEIANSHDTIVTEAVLDNLFDNFDKINLHELNAFIDKQAGGGWIRIITEADLPKVRTHYHTVDREGIVGLWGYRDEAIAKSVWLREFTHYRPIEKPGKPKK